MRKQKSKFFFFFFAFNYLVTKCSFVLRRQGKPVCYVTRSDNKLGDKTIQKRADIPSKQEIQDQLVTPGECVEEVRVIIYNWKL